MTVAIRSASGSVGIADEVRSAIRSTSAEIVVTRPRTFDEQVGGLLVRERTLAFLSAWFGILALVLACVGLYGVMSQDVMRRRREIGIRLTLGADASRVLADVIKETATLAVAGIGAGAVAALALTKLIEGLLFDVSARDPLTFTMAACILAAATLLAGYLPARRAAAVDPTSMLRSSQ
jgi:ABC-type antimicrobial peptide transport system permease subunit